MFSGKLKKNVIRALPFALCIAAVMAFTVKAQNAPAPASSAHVNFTQTEIVVNEFDQNPRGSDLYSGMFKVSVSLDAPQGTPVQGP